MSYLDRDPFGMYRDRDNSGPGPHLMGADTLMGEDVYNRQEEDLGDIKEFMIDMQSGKIAYAVLSFGGIMGMGNKLFAVPFQALQLDTVNKRFILDVAKERLENAPGFDKDRWPDMASAEFGTQVSSFWGGAAEALPGQMTSTGSVMGSGSSTMQSSSSFGQSQSGSQSGSLSGSASGSNLGSSMGSGGGLSSQSGSLGSSTGLGSNSLDLGRSDSDITDKNVNQAGGLSNQNTSIDPSKKY